jgi:Ca2+-binding EF-hand superfamily protein
MVDVTKIFDGTEIYQMQLLWESLDENADGTITLDELEHALKTAGSLSAADIEKILQHVDENHDGVVSFEEYCMAQARATGKVNLVDKDDEVEQLFRLFDSDGSGEIQAHELGNVVTKLGMGMDEAACEDIIKMADVDGGGSIDYEEFKKVMIIVRSEVERRFEVAMMKTQIKYMDKKIIELGNKEGEKAAQDMEYVFEQQQRLRVRLHDKEQALNTLSMGGSLEHIVRAYMCKFQSSESIADSISSFFEMLQLDDPRTMKSRMENSGAVAGGVPDLYLVRPPASAGLRPGDWKQWRKHLLFGTPLAGPPPRAEQREGHTNHAAGVDLSVAAAPQPDSWQERCLRQAQQVYTFYSALGEPGKTHAMSPHCFHLFAKDILARKGDKELEAGAWALDHEDAATAAAHLYDEDDAGEAAAAASAAHEAGVPPPPEMSTADRYKAARRASVEAKQKMEQKEALEKKLKADAEKLKVRNQKHDDQALQTFHECCMRSTLDNDDNHHTLTLMQWEQAVMRLLQMTMKFEHEPPAGGPLFYRLMRDIVLPKVDPRHQPSKASALICAPSASAVLCRRLWQLKLVFEHYTDPSLKEKKEAPKGTKLGQLPKYLAREAEEKAAREAQAAALLLTETGTADGKKKEKEHHFEGELRRPPTMMHAGELVQFCKDFQLFSAESHLSKKSIHDAFDEVNTSESGPDADKATLSFGQFVEVLGHLALVLFPLEDMDTQLKLNSSFLVFKGPEGTKDAMQAEQMFAEKDVIENEQKRVDDEEKREAELDKLALGATLEELQLEREVEELRGQQQQWDEQKGKQSQKQQSQQSQEQTTTVEGDLSQAELAEAASQASLAFKTGQLGKSQKTLSFEPMHKGIRARRAVGRMDSPQFNRSLNPFSSTKVHQQWLGEHRVALAQPEADEEMASETLDSATVRAARNAARSRAQAKASEFAERELEQLLISMLGAGAAKPRQQALKEAFDAVLETEGVMRWVGRRPRPDRPVLELEAPVPDGDGSRAQSRASKRSPSRKPPGSRGNHRSSAVPGRRSSTRAASAGAGKVASDSDSGSGTAVTDNGSSEERDIAAETQRQLEIDTAEAEALRDSPAGRTRKLSASARAAASTRRAPKGGGGGRQSDRRPSKSRKGSTKAQVGQLNIAVTHVDVDAEMDVEFESAEREAAQVERPKGKMRRSALVQPLVQGLRKCKGLWGVDPEHIPYQFFYSLIEKYVTVGSIPLGAAAPPAAAAAAAAADAPSDGSAILPASQLPPAATWAQFVRGAKMCGRLKQQEERRAYDEAQQQRQKEMRERRIQERLAARTKPSDDGSGTTGAEGVPPGMGMQVSASLPQLHVASQLFGNANAMADSTPPLADSAGAGSGPGEATPSDDEGGKPKGPDYAALAELKPWELAIHKRQENVDAQQAMFVMAKAKAKIKGKMRTKKEQKAVAKAVLVAKRTFGPEVDAANLFFAELMPIQPSVASDSPAPAKTTRQPAPMVGAPFKLEDSSDDEEEQEQERALQEKNARKAAKKAARKAAAAEAAAVAAQAQAEAEAAMVGTWSTTAVAAEPELEPARVPLAAPTGTRSVVAGARRDLEESQGGTQASGSLVRFSDEVLSEPVRKSRGGARASRGISQSVDSRGGACGGLGSTLPDLQAMSYNPRAALPAL